MRRKSAAGQDTAHGIAARGVSGAGKRLDFHDRIQSSFGRYDVSGVRAHIGPAAREAGQRLDATAYTFGNDVAFARAPDLRTVAHEAAHAVRFGEAVVVFGADGDELLHVQRAPAAELVTLCIDPSSLSAARSDFGLAT